MSLPVLVMPNTEPRYRSGMLQCARPFGRWQVAARNQVQALTSFMSLQKERA